MLPTANPIPQQLAQGALSTQQGQTDLLMLGAIGPMQRALLLLKGRLASASMPATQPVAILEKTLGDLGDQYRSAVLTDKVPLAQWVGVAEKAWEALLAMAREAKGMKIDDGSVEQMLSGGRVALDQLKKSSSPTGSLVLPLGLLAVAGLAWWAYRAMSRDEKKQARLSESIELDDEYDEYDEDDLDGIETVRPLGEGESWSELEDDDEEDAEFEET